MKVINFIPASKPGERFTKSLLYVLVDGIAYDFNGLPFVNELAVLDTKTLVDVLALARERGIPRDTRYFIGKHGSERPVAELAAKTWAWGSIRDLYGSDLDAIEEAIELADDIRLNVEDL
jgi:hypothetical protein